MKEDIKYNPITGKGKYIMTDGGLSVTLNFYLPKCQRGEKQHLLSKLRQARHRIYKHAFGDVSLNGYTGFINFVSTWLTPDPDMMTSRNMTSKEIVEKQEAMYQSCNLANGKVLHNGAINLDAFAEDYFKEANNNRRVM